MQNSIMISSEKRKKKLIDKHFAPRSTQGVQPSIKSVIVDK